MREIKDITIGEKARKEIMEGVTAVASIVKLTLGPKGRNVLIEGVSGTPVVTKDGVSVARTIFLEGKNQNMGAQAIKQAASRTVDLCGDGTTSTTIIAHSLLAGGNDLIKNGISPMSVKQGIELAAEHVLEKLEEYAIPVNDDSEKIKSIAEISANGDTDIADLISNTLKQLGHNSVITVEEASGLESRVEVTLGLRMERGYLSPHFITNGNKQTAELDDPFILLLNSGLSTMHDLLHLLELVATKNRSLLVIAAGIEGEALNTLVINKLRGSVKVAAIQAPGFGHGRDEYFEDLAAVTGATIIGKSDVQLDEVGEKHLGSADKVVLNKDYSTLSGGGGQLEALQNRIAVVEKSLKDAHKDMKESIEVRLSGLKGGVAVMYIGAATEIEMKEKRDRVDDALAATKSAVEEGVVAGGGLTLYDISNKLEKQPFKWNKSLLKGYVMALEAFRSPCLLILSHANYKIPSDLEYPKWRNARTGKICDFLKDGIIDPAKVERVVIENAVSVAGTLLLAEGIVTIRDKSI